MDRSLLLQKPIPYLAYVTEHEIVHAELHAEVLPSAFQDVANAPLLNKLGEEAIAYAISLGRWGFALSSTGDNRYIDLEDLGFDPTKLASHLRGLTADETAIYTNMSDLNEAVLRVEATTNLLRSSTGNSQASTVAKAIIHGVFDTNSGDDAIEALGRIRRAMSALPEGEGTLRSAFEAQFENALSRAIQQEHPTSLHGPPESRGVPAGAHRTSTGSVIYE